MKVKLLLVILTSMSFWCGAVVGDSDVYLPRQDSVIGGASPAIYWRYQPGANGYMIDLVGPNSTGASCDGRVHYLGYISTPTAACGIKRVADFGYGDPMPSDTILCRWYAGDLREGHYRLSVSAFSFRTGWVGADTLFRGDCSTDYQHFEVEYPTRVPHKPVLQVPVSGLDCEAYTFSLVTQRYDGCYLTISNVDPSASWVQLWVNDANNVNIINRWYPIHELECVVELGQTRCSFEDLAQSPYFGAASPYTWWVRAWNPAGASDWTAGAIFTYNS